MKRTYFRLNIFILILVITAFSVRFSFKLARVLVWRRQIWTSTVTTARVLVQKQTSIINSASSALRVELVKNHIELCRRYFIKIQPSVGLICCQNVDIYCRNLSARQECFSKVLPLKTIFFYNHEVPLKGKKMEGGNEQTLVKGVTL